MKRLFGQASTELCFAECADRDAQHEHGEAGSWAEEDPPDHTADDPSDCGADEGNP